MEWTINYTPRTFILWQRVIETYQRNIRRIGKKNGIKSKKENIEYNKNTREEKNVKTSLKEKG